MKKRTMLCLTAAAVTLSLGAGAMAMAAELPAAGELTLSLGAENDGAFSTAFDQEGNLLGPSDSAADGKRSYILNTATNCIYEYQDGVQKQQISLDKFGSLGTKIAAQGDGVYVLDKDRTVVRFENGRAEVLGNLAEDMTFDNAVGFDVTEAYRYVSEPTREGGRTLRYAADAATGEWSLDRIIEGYMVDDNTFYQSRILGEQIVGPVCEITIRDADGRVKDTITLKAENIAGAQYLGKNQEGMNLVKQLDMVTHEDGTCSVEETIRTVSAEGAVY